MAHCLPPSHPNNSRALFNLFFGGGAGGCIIEMPPRRCHFRFAGTSFHPWYSRVCGRSPCPSFRRCYIRETSLSSPLRTRARAHTHTRARTHGCAQPDANMTACQHLRPSFYQPGLNIDPIDCPKALLPFAAENASPQAALMETEAQSHPQARPCYTQVTGLYHRCGDCDVRIVRTCVLALKSLVVWWTTCTGEETGVCV